MSITGRNWGSATLDGATMVFAVGSKPAFRIPLKDVNQVQQNKEEVRSQPQGCAFMRCSISGSHASPSDPGEKPRHVPMQVLLEFAIDDTVGGENEDALTEIGFYVPKEATGFQDGNEHSAKVGADECC